MGRIGEKSLTLGSRFAAAGPGGFRQRHWKRLERRAAAGSARFPTIRTLTLIRTEEDERRQQQQQQQQQYENRVGRTD